MTKFTPGPWYKNFTGDAKWEINADGYPVSDVYGWTQKIDEANARLIAAAPAMFEALNDAVSNCPTCGGIGVIPSEATWGEAARGYSVPDDPCPTCNNWQGALKLATGGSDD